MAPCKYIPWSQRKRDTMTSLGFSEFRNLLDTWDEAASDMRIRSLIDTNSLVLFIEKDKKIYGAPEASRLVFAQMKNPDEDAPEGWKEEANFTVFDLEEALKGRKIQAVINYKDLSSIKILDEAAVIKKLSKKGKEEPADLETGGDPTAPDAPANMDKLGEK
jgi:hypothetical protein